MTTTTELRLQYVQLSWDYDFPAEIETILEDDYVVFKHLYSKDALNRVRAVLMIDPSPSSEVVLHAIRIATFNSATYEE